MPPKPKKNRDQFEIPNKHRIKLEKKDRKEHLRHKNSSTHNLKESPVNSDDEEVNKGQQWWHKVDRRFFRELSPQQLVELHGRVQGDELLQLKYPAKMLGNYLYEEIAPYNQCMVNPTLLRVLFRKQYKLEGSEYNQIVSFGFKQYQEPRQFSKHEVSENVHLDSLRPPHKSWIDKIPEEEFNLDIEIVNIEKRQEEVMKILRYDVIESEHAEVDREIILLEQQLNNVCGRNGSNWNSMIERRQYHPLSRKHGEQIAQIHRDLRMTQVLLYFKRGHSDKTEEMLEQALQVARIREMNDLGQSKQKNKDLTRLQKLKEIFETDCKICFCTESQDKNRVVYCDGCNTSFHQACYGVEELTEDKFYCQVCLFTKLYTVKDKEGVSKYPKKPSCRLCYKQNFPMKQLQGRFYHVTCLVLFDLVQMKNYEIQFKNGINPQALLSKLVQNELSHGYCKFCTKEGGMKFGCQWEGCKMSYHPICAYLNGVYFQLNRTYNSLSAKLTCSEHFPERDNFHQVYLRRFFCDFNSTSTMTDEQFKERFDAEIERRKTNMAFKLKQLKLGVLKKGKFYKSLKSSPLPKSKSDKQENPGPRVDLDMEMTQIRKLMQQISENNRSN